MSDENFISIFKSMYPELKRHLDMTTLRHWDKKISESKNILNKYGKKYFSQNDEDGILLEILKRLNLKSESFLEIGVGGLRSNNGTENNTIILLMLGWKGIWIDSQNINLNLTEKSKLKFNKKYITKENCNETVQKSMKSLNLSKKDIKLYPLILMEMIFI